MTKFELTYLNMSCEGHKKEATKDNRRSNKPPSSSKKACLEDDSKSAGSKSSSQKLRRKTKQDDVSADIGTHGDVPEEIFVPVKLDCELLINDSYLVKDKSKVIESTFIYDDDIIPNVSNFSETIISNVSHETCNSAVNAQDIGVYNIQDDNMDTSKSTPSATETPTTICPVDTIGAVCSRRIL